MSYFDKKKSKKYAFVVIIPLYSGYVRNQEIWEKIKLQLNLALPPDSVGDPMRIFGGLHTSAEILIPF